MKQHGRWKQRKKDTRPSVEEKIERRKNIEEPKVNEDTRPLILKKKKKLKTNTEEQDENKKYLTTY